MISTNKDGVEVAHFKGDDKLISHNESAGSNKEILADKPS